jgi:hypothetical protein
VTVCRNDIIVRAAGILIHRAAIRATLLNGDLSERMAPELPEVVARAALGGHER